MSVVGCFVGGVGIYKEPSGFAVHLISLTFSTATFDRGALSMPKPAYKTHLREKSDEPSSVMVDFKLKENIKKKFI